VRNACLALLVLNLVYFSWAHWVDAPLPAAVNEALAKLPRLKLVDELPESQRHASAPPPPQAACLSLGPFPDLDNSARAAAILKQKGFDPKQRAEEGQSSDGYWVYIGGLSSQAETDKALVTLERNGIKDAIVMPETPEAGRRLSLGLYSERARADRRAQTVNQTGLKAEVGERKIPGALYWVDLAPLPGMNTVPLQDLFAQGVSSHIAVQPCPPSAAAATPPAGSVATAAAAVPAAPQPPPATADKPAAH
jgi:hypothetical protein